MTTRRGTRGRQAPAAPVLGAPFTFKAGQGFADVATAAKGPPLSNGSNSAGQPSRDTHIKPHLRKIWTKELNTLSPAILQAATIFVTLLLFLHRCHLCCFAYLLGFSTGWFPCIQASLS